MTRQTTIRTARVRAGLRRILGTLAVAAIAGAAVIGGTRLIAANAAGRTEAVAADPLRVAVVPVQRSDSYTVTRQFIGRIEPGRRSEIGFEEGGTVVAVLADEGDTVAEGAVLARLDTRALDAERDRLAAASAALEAQIELARLTANRQHDLAARNVASAQRADETRLALRELEARRDELAAQSQALAVRRDKAVLRAPFAGRVGTRHLDEGVRIGPATPVLELLDTGAARVRIGLPSDLAAALEPGTTFEVALDDRPARLRLLSPGSEIDPVTRTRDTLFEVVGDLPGSATYGDLVTVSAPRQVAAEGVWLPATALIEGERGLWTVLVVQPDPEGANRVIRESVEVLHAGTERVYVRGPLPEGAGIVATGPHRLESGQVVLPVAAAPES